MKKRPWTFCSQYYRCSSNQIFSIGVSFRCIYYRTSIVQEYWLCWHVWDTWNELFTEFYVIPLTPHKVLITALWIEGKSCELFKTFITEFNAGTLHSNVAFPRKLSTLVTAFPAFLKLSLVINHRWWHKVWQFYERTEGCHNPGTKVVLIDHWTTKPGRRETFIPFWSGFLYDLSIIIPVNAN